ncbi:MAG: FHA domain-containing protein [Myxococcaceae bacterium]|nr:FHA domain-containing protein [Myxococcaceae bacterium]
MIAPLSLSVLYRQRMLLGAGFLEKYPHPWLIWESGPGRPSEGPAPDVLETRTPRQAGPARTPSHEPIAFPLAGARPLRVGRATSNDLVVDDVTVSRELGRLRCEGDKWFFDRVSPPVTIPLSSGLALSHGEVWFTFLSAADLLARLEAIP